MRAASTDKSVHSFGIRKRAEEPGVFFSPSSPAIVALCAIIAAACLISNGAAQRGQAEEGGREGGRVAVG